MTDDTSTYEAVYVDSPPPGKYLIIDTQTENGGKREHIIVEVENLEVKDGLLICNYEVLNEPLGDSEAVRLITNFLIKEFCGNYYYDQAKQIQFTNIKSKVSKIVPYLL